MAEAATKPKTVKLQFAPAQASPTLEITNGDYVRKFDVKVQPFECDASEEAPFLLRTGDFVEVAKAPKSKAKAQPKSKSKVKTKPKAKATTDARIAADDGTKAQVGAKTDGKESAIASTADDALAVTSEG